MRTLLLRTTLLGALNVLIGPLSAAAQWQPLGAPVCMNPASQDQPSTVSDGAGGVVIVWVDDRDRGSIVAQRLNAAGIVQWTPEGVPLVRDASWLYGPIPIVSDGEGGAIAVWGDHRDGIWTTYVQRVSGDGSLAWTPGGVPVLSSEATHHDVAIESDGAGGAIVTWMMDGYPLESAIHAQRIDASGVARWGPAGVVVGSDGFQPRITSDGSGGAVIAWSTGDCDIYAQAVSADGIPRWTADGVALCRALGCQLNAVIVPDGAGGAIVAWQDGRTNESHVYAQRVTADGRAAWAMDGVPISVADVGWLDAAMVADGSGGAVLTWSDRREGETRVYAQRLNGDGMALWIAGGVPVCTALETQVSPALASDGTGGAIIAWSDYRNVHSIYARRVDADGVPQWTTDGVALCTWFPIHYGPAIASDGAGGAIVVWGDFRRGYLTRRDEVQGDIFAQLIALDGTTHPAPGPARIAASTGTIAAALAPALAPRGVPEPQTIRLWNRGDRAWPFTTFIDFDWRSATSPENGIVSAGLWPTVILEPRSGVIAPGESLDVMVTFDASAATEGDHEVVMAIAGLNSVEPIARVRFLMHVGVLAGRLDVWPDRFIRKPLREGSPLKDDLGDPLWMRDREVIATLTLPPGVNPTAVDRGSVRLQRVLAPLEARPHDPSGNRFRFDRDAVLKLLPPSGEAVVELSGELEGITWFAGVDTVRVVALPGSDPTGVPATERPDRDGLRLLGRNPVSAAASLELALGAPASIRVRVYDLRGALVRELAHGPWQAGLHTLAWDGRSASGAGARSGVYFVNLETPRETVTLRVVLAR